MSMMSREEEIRAAALQAACIYCNGGHFAVSQVAVVAKDYFEPYISDGKVR